MVDVDAMVLPLSAPLPARRTDRPPSGGIRSSRSA